MGFQWTFLCLCLFIGEIECGGQIWLKLVSFQNREGLDAFGILCDHHWGFKTSDCDHKFIICLENIDGYCSYGLWRTATIRNAAYFTFGQDISLPSNPKTFSFHKWTGSCKLKIDVYDDDTLEDDYIDSMTGHYFLDTPYHNETNAITKTLNLSNRVSMTVKMTVYCNPNYYGRGCDIYCVPSSKYTCNRITGAKRCTSGWTGPDCHIKKNACVSAPCKNKSSCYSTKGTYRCVCNDGYTGRQCEKEINECSSFPCKNNGTCVDLIDNYKCTCPYGYSGDDCDSLTNLCKKNLCLNNSTCVMDPNDVVFHCECGNGWNGRYCQSDVNECEDDVCKNRGKCKNFNGGFDCECENGYTGKFCNNEIDECSGNPCFHNGSCHDLVGAFRCKCTEGYSGKVCDIDIDECNSSPCLNDGICVNTNGSFYCQCSDSWNGKYCQSDVNECEDDVCKNGGDCQNFDGGFDCECKTGYTGKLCHKEIDECLGNPCFHNGSCHDLVDSFTCHCTEGYSGNVCDLDINECHSHPCRNGGMCFNNYGSFYCQCPDTSNGTLCEFNVNECNNNICKNGGECENIAGEFSCSGIVCNGVNDNFVIYLDQNVTSAIRRKIVSKIKWFIHRYTGYEVDSLKIDEFSETYKGDMISNVSLSLSINGSKVCGENLEKLRRLLKRNESEFPFNIFNGSISDLNTQPEDLTEGQKNIEKAWLEDNWYLVMLAVGFVVLTALVVFVLLIYNRRKRRPSSSVHVYVNGSFEKQLKKQRNKDGHTTITSC